MNARAIIFSLTLGVLSLLAAPAGPRAQVNLPPVQVPSLPRVETPVDLDRTVDQVTGRLDPQALRDVRIARVRDLLRRHRDVIEADPQGAPIRRSEVLAFSPTAQALDAASAAGFTVVREKDLEGLDARIVVLRAPPRMSTRRALKQLRTRDPGGTYDYNHIYTESGTTAASGTTVAQSGAGPQPTPAPTPTPTPTQPPPPPSLRARAGLIDGGIDTGHPVFRNAQIEMHGCEGRVVPTAHGTAVASLIVGQADSFSGAAKNASLYAADVYCGAPTGGAVDAVVDAMAWLARERVPVINVSLVGPPNAMLENVTRALLARGHLLVAAVGNDGPAARPLYPAGYPGVIAVTGVDASRRVLVEACRGPHVDLAAPGADMAAASLENRYAAVRGTSFAAPIVAGLLAAQLHTPDAPKAAAALQELSSSAIDLGARGRDKTYGEGLVGDALRVDPRVAGAAISQNDK